MMCSVNPVSFCPPPMLTPQSTKEGHHKESEVISDKTRAEPIDKLETKKMSGWVIAIYVIVGVIIGFLIGIVSSFN